MKILFKEILEKNRWLGLSLARITGLSKDAIYSTSNGKAAFWDTKFAIYQALKNLDLIDENVTINKLFSKTEIEKNE